MGLTEGWQTIASVTKVNSSSWFEILHLILHLTHIGLSTEMHTSQTNI
jgi:hypothetical protein